jgi:hypothetical protein
MFLFPNTSLPLGLYLLAVGAIVLFIELPSCCTCAVWCTKITSCLHVFTGYWIVRAVVYIGLSAGGYAIYEIKRPEPNGSLIITVIMLTFAAAIYIVATILREPNPAAKKAGPSADDAAPVPVDKPKSKAATPKGAATGSAKGAAAGGAATGAAAPPSKADNPFNSPDELSRV